jgi:hypothetical protein
MSRLYHFSSGLFLSASFVLLVAAVLERIANFTGYTILRRALDPGRLLEFAVVFLLFFMALALKEIRDGARTS